MTADRYLKAVLTLIALELGWIALTLSGSPVSAQQQPQGTPVVITGIDLERSTDYLPVGVLGQVRNTPATFQPVATTIRSASGQGIARSMRPGRTAGATTATTAMTISARRVAVCTRPSVMRRPARLPRPVPSSSENSVTASE